MGAFHGWTTGKNIGYEFKTLSPITLFLRAIVNIEIVVLNCQKCIQCLISSWSQLLFEGVTYLDGEAMSPHQSNHVLKVKVNKVKYRSISGQLRKPKTKRMTITIKHRRNMVSSSIRHDSFQPEAL